MGRGWGGKGEGKVTKYMNYRREVCKGNAGGSGGGSSSSGVEVCRNKYINLIDS